MMAVTVDGTTMHGNTPTLMVSQLALHIPTLQLLELPPDAPATFMITLSTPDITPTLESLIKEAFLLPMQLNSKPLLLNKSSR